ncbi:MAG: hypothetical protein L6W00_12555 [Lentisphaeria bacterium]|nr:MAG: hypothetical protein L6W00_12555 [Lentisphaeria bacterium]
MRSGSAANWRCSTSSAVTCGGELPDAAGFDLFFDEVREEHGLHENRFARKGREYAVELYTAVAVHREKIDETIRQRSSTGTGTGFRWSTATSCGLRLPRCSTSTRFRRW